MSEVKYVKEKGVSIKKHERVYAKENGYATNRFKEGYMFLGFATRHSPKWHKDVVTSYRTESNSASGVMMQKRGGRSFGQFNEMLQNAKEGKRVVYASILGNFRIIYIDDKKDRIDTLCRGFDVNNVKEMAEQMQNFGCKPGEKRNRKETPKTTAEALQDLNNEIKKLFAEIAKHKRSFFDFALGIIIGTTIGGYFICFLGR